MLVLVHLVIIGAEAIEIKRKASPHELYQGTICLQLKVFKLGEEKKAFLCFRKKESFLSVPL